MIGDLAVVSSRSAGAVVDADGIGRRALCRTLVLVGARVCSMLITETHASDARLDVFRDDVPRVVEGADAAGVGPATPVLPHLVRGAGMGLVLAMHFVASADAHDAWHGLRQTTAVVSVYGKHSIRT